MLVLTSCHLNVSSNQFSQYPVITANEASRDRWLHQNPAIVTTSTNRNLLHPTRDNKIRRRSEINDTLDQGKDRASSSGDHRGKRSSQIANTLPTFTRNKSASSESSKSNRSQLVDLVVEDRAAEGAERVRARKEGGAAWNESEAKHFV